MTAGTITAEQITLQMIETDRRLYSEEILSFCKYYRNEQESKIFTESSSSVSQLWKAEREALQDLERAYTELQESVSEDLFSLQVCKRLTAAGREDLTEIYRSEASILSDPVSLITLRSYLGAKAEAQREAAKIEQLISEYQNTAARRSCLDREISKLKAPIQNTAEDLFYYDLKCISSGDGDLIEKLSDRFSCLLRSQHRDADQQDEQEIFTFFYRQKLTELLRDLQKQLSDGRSYTIRTNTQGDALKIPVELLSDKAEQIYRKAQDLGLMTEDPFVFSHKMRRACRAYFLDKLHKALIAKHPDEDAPWRKLSPVFEEKAKRMEQGFCLHNTKGAGDPKILALIDLCFESLN